MGVCECVYVETYNYIKISFHRCVCYKRIFIYNVCSKCVDRLLTGLRFSSHVLSHICVCIAIKSNIFVSS